MFKSELLERILPTSGAKAGKCLNRISWMPFCRLLGSGSQVALRMLLEVHFEHYCLLVARWLSESFWRLILCDSGSLWLVAWVESIFWVDAGAID